MKKVLALLLSVAVLASLCGCGMADKKWIIVTETYFKPFEYYNENNEFVGIDVDLLAAIAKDQGITYELAPIGWDAGVASCKAGLADGIIAAASVTDARKEEGWIFSDSYYDACVAFAVPKDSTIVSYSDLAGLNVAVKKGTISEDFADSLMEKYGFTISVFDDTPSVFEDVALGNSAACIEDEPIIAASIKDGIDLKMIDGMKSEATPYAMAVFNVTDKSLIKAFNAGLANIKENGTYQEILDKYTK